MYNYKDMYVFKILVGDYRKVLHGEFEIEAQIPITGTTTDVYLIEAETKEEALEIFKSGEFDQIKCFVDSYGIDDAVVNPNDFIEADINYIEEVDD